MRGTIHRKCACVTYTFIYRSNRHKHMNKVIDHILEIIERLSSKMGTWSWQKRWKNRDAGYGYKSGKIFKR